MRGHCLCQLNLLIVLLMAGQPAAQGLTHSQAVEFDLYRDYLIVARGSVGPIKGLNFLLDTGATPTVLDRRIAQKLHLGEQPGVLAGLNGRVATGVAAVPSLQFGPVKRDHLPVVIEDLSFFDKALPVRIDAVIGLDVVGQGPFEIDYRARQILFGPIPSLKDSLRLRMRAGLPLVDAELNETRVHLLLDTGASSTILFEPKTPTSVAPVEISAVQHSSNMIGEFDRKQVTLRSLRLGEMEFRQEPAFLVHTRGDGTEDFDGLVSPALLGFTKVAIDLNHGVVTLGR